MDDMRSLRRALAKLTDAVNRLTTSATTQAVKIALLSDALTAVNAKTQRAAVSVTGLAVGNVDVAIVWPQPWPDTAYAIVPTIVSGTGALGSLAATLKSGTKTAAGCTVTVANTGLSAVGAFAVDVIGIRT